MEVYCQGNGGLNVFGCEIGNEVVMAIVVLSANGSQSTLCTHRLCQGEMFHFLGFLTIDDV